jgi:muconolactone delta-isomerase
LQLYIQHKKEKCLNYFIELKLADSARPKSPQDSVAFIEGFVLPSLEIMDKWQKEGQVLAGGPVAGAIALALIIKAESVQELEELCESLPLWPVMETRVVPLQTFSGRRTAVQDLLKSLRERVASKKS